MPMPGIPFGAIAEQGGLAAAQSMSGGPGAGEILATGAAGTLSQLPSMLYGRRIRRKSDKARREAERFAFLRQEMANQDLDQAQADVMREAGIEREGLIADRNEAIPGMSDSWSQQALARQDYDRKRRLQAIERARKQGELGFNQYAVQANLDRQIQRAQTAMGRINLLSQFGLSAIGAMAGGGKAV